MSLVTEAPHTDAAQPDVRIARTTGLLYLALGLCGMAGFLLIRPQLFDPADPAATLARLVEYEGLARIGIALELTLVVTQVLAALWFYRLFRPVDRASAGAIAVFATLNGVAFVGSAAFLGAALTVALDPVGADASQLMYIVSENFWGVGNLFFGLWLIPMGVAALRSGWTPRPLGWILVGGGVCYLVSAYVNYLAPSAGAISGVLVVPATIGEFWMIGWLLLRGVRRSRL